MRKGEPLELICPKCQDAEYQKPKSILLTGGHEVNWAKRTEHNWAQARILVHCQLCKHDYYIHRKQKS